VSVSVVQLLPSEQEAGQLPSHVSPFSTTPLPHLGLQSPSLLALQPGAQQPSPLAHATMAAWLHCTLHLRAVPDRVSVVQAFESLQFAGQLPSHVSPFSTVPLPHVAEQSVSFVLLQPLGQQPSPELHALMIE
jgi:hypothetical protein